MERVGLLPQTEWFALWVFLSIVCGLIRHWSPRETYKFLSMKGIVL